MGQDADWRQLSSCLQLRNALGCLQLCNALSYIQPCNTLSASLSRTAAVCVNGGPPAVPPPLSKLTKLAPREGSAAQLGTRPAALWCGVLLAQAAPQALPGPACPAVLRLFDALSVPLDCPVASVTLCTAL